MGLRRARYLGIAKTRLQHLITAAAINLVRLAAWIGERPAARTRHSAFARLMLASTRLRLTQFASSIMLIAKLGGVQA
jgi:hypothetical protein